MSNISGSFRPWIGEVVSLDDPEKLGRVQLRIKGLHDDKANIPDSDLHWARILHSPTDPAIGKKGHNGVGLLVGSQVFVQFWDQTHGQQQPMIVGSIPKAGDAKEGSTSNSSTDLDKTKADTPTGTRGKDKNPVLDKPQKDAKQSGKLETDEGSNAIDDRAKKGAKFKDLRSIGTLEQAAGEILDKIKKVDPSNVGGAVQQALQNFIQIRDITSLTSLSGLTSMASGALQGALAGIAKDLGVGSLLGALHGVMSDVQGLANLAQDQLGGILGSVSGVVDQVASGTLVVPSGTTLTTSAAALIQDVTADHVGMVIDTAAHQVMGFLKPIVASGGLLASHLSYALDMAKGLAKSLGENLILGVGLDGILGQITSLLPDIGGNILKTIQEHLPNSVLDQSKVTDAVKGHSRNMAVLKKKEDLAKAVFQAGPNQMSDVASKVKELSQNVG